MIENYKYFLGKVCTVLTQPVNFPFRDARQHADFFSGLVTEINEEGVRIKHLLTNTHAFFPFPIVGIVEEQAVSKKDPNYEKIRQELEKKAPVKSPPGDFLSVEEMKQMAKRIKANTS